MTKASLEGAYEHIKEICDSIETDVDWIKPANKILLNNCKAILKSTALNYDECNKLVDKDRLMDILAYIDKFSIFTDGKNDNTYENMLWFVGDIKHACAKDLRVDYSSNKYLPSL